MNHGQNEHELEDLKGTKKQKRWKRLLEKGKFKAVLVLIAIIIIIFITVLIFFLSRKESSKLNSLKQDKIHNSTIIAPVKETATIGILSTYKTTTSSQLVKKESTSPNLINASEFIPNLITQASFKHTLPFITTAIRQPNGFRKGETIKDETTNTISNGNEKNKAEISSTKVPKITDDESILNYDDKKNILKSLESMLEVSSSTKTALTQITMTSNIDIETRSGPSEAYSNTMIEAITAKPTASGTIKSEANSFDATTLTITPTVTNTEIGEVSSNEFLSDVASTTIRTTTSSLTTPDISTITVTLKTSLTSDDLTANKQKIRIKTTKKSILKKMNPDKAHKNSKKITHLELTTTEQQHLETFELKLEPVDFFIPDSSENEKDSNNFKNVEAIDLGQFKNDDYDVFNFEQVYL